ncbi:5-oxoprolinase subunit PxpA [Nocardioides sp. NPDC092400]|uniref:LamB/YcsF family protein n=1 Tax=Nocardioides sp. NPDC092400 TaxID=3155196 RepID=UPI003437F80D
MTALEPSPPAGATALTVDLNADLAEGYGAWTFGCDDDLLSLVTSANVACGFHGGDPSTIRRAVETAVARGVVIGAHVGYPDLQGFGRRNMDIGHQELVDLTVYQLAALDGVTRVAGSRVRYVKPHGALYNRVARDAAQAEAVAEAVASFDNELRVLSLPGSALHRAAHARGLDTLDEVFGDRAYLASGALAPRSTEGSVIHDPDQVAKRVLQMVRHHTVNTLDDTTLDVVPDSVCIHGDSPGAVQLAAAVRHRLEEAGVSVRSPLAPAQPDRRPDAPR